LVEETGGPGENHRKSLTNLFTYNVVHLALIEIRNHNISSCTDCIGSCKSNYHTIVATTAPYTFDFHLYEYLKLYYHYDTVLKCNKISILWFIMINTKFNLLIAFICCSSQI
jgi:hypothetical protein